MFSWGIPLSLKLPRGSFYLLPCVIELHLPCPRSSSSSDHLRFIHCSWDFKLETLIDSCLSSDHLTSSDKAQGPIYDFGPLSLQYIYIYISKLVYAYLLILAILFYKITLYSFNNIVDYFKSNVITTIFSTIFLQTV